MSEAEFLQNEFTAYSISILKTSQKFSIFSLSSENDIVNVEVLFKDAVCASNITEGQKNPTQNPKPATDFNKSRFKLPVYSM